MVLRGACVVPVAVNAANTGCFPVKPPSMRTPRLDSQSMTAGSCRTLVSSTEPDLLRSPTNRVAFAVIIIAPERRLGEAELGMALSIAGMSAGFQLKTCFAGRLRAIHLEHSSSQRHRHIPHKARAANAMEQAVAG